MTEPSNSSEPQSERSTVDPNSQEADSGFIEERPVIWDVSECREYISNDEQVKAIGKYTVDTSRGYNSKSKEPEFIKEGSFGMVIDVKDETNERQRKEFVLRISADKIGFEKQWDFSFLVNTILNDRKSPVFLKMRTAFVCDKVPSLGGDWDDVTGGIALKFGGENFIDEFNRSAEKEIPFRLYYIVMQRANLFSVQTMIKQWEISKDPSVRIETEFKRVLMLELAQGLAAMHQTGIAHRDIKSGNTVLSQRNTRGNISFVFFNRKFQHRIYRVKEPEIVPGIDNAFLQRRGRPKGFVRPHFIDWDFSMQSLGGQIKYYYSEAKGTPSSIAPEIIYLTYAGFNRTQWVFKPDIFSMGMMFSEIITGYTISSLIMLEGEGYAFNEERLIQRNVIFVIAAYTGFPSESIINQYKMFMESYLENVEKTPETAEQRSIVMDKLESLNLLFEFESTLRGILAQRRSGFKVPDFIEQKWGISAALFQKGILFDYLDKLVSEKKVRRKTQTLLRRMLRWNFEKRPSASQVVFSNTFDKYLVDDVNENDSVWILPVSRLSPAPIRVLSEETGETTPSIFRNVGDGYESIPITASDELFGLAEQDEVGEDESPVYHDLQDKLERNECLMPGCLNKTSNKYLHKKNKKPAFCSGKCFRVYEKYDWHPIEETQEIK